MAAIPKMFVFSFLVKQGPGSNPSKFELLILNKRNSNSNCIVINQGQFCSDNIVWFRGPEEELDGRTNEWFANPLGLRRTSAQHIKTRSA